MSRSPARKKDLLGSYPAMLRAAQRAREVARLHGTPLVVMKSGKVVEIPPDKIKDLPKRLLRIAFGDDYVPAKRSVPRPRSKRTKTAKRGA